MAITYHAGRRIQGTSTDFGTAGAGIPAVSGGWKELGRTTLGSSSATIDVASLADKRYLMVLLDIDGVATNQTLITFNGDGTSNYAYRYSDDGGADFVAGTQPYNYWYMETGAVPKFTVANIANLAGKEKLVIRGHVTQSTAGSGTSPRRRMGVEKWANIVDPIDQITSTSTSANGYGTGSEMVVLGWDPTDTHTTNFWEELANVELGANGDNLSSGTISAKKYLWVQAAIMTSSAGTNVQHQITFNNNTTGNNYAQRYSYQGGTDISTLVSRNNWQFSAGSNNKGIAFLNFFIINNAANEKLCIGDTVMGDTAGAGAAPKREEAVAKWTNTTDQITEIDIDNTLASIDYKAGSFIKVWGSN